MSTVNATIHWSKPICREPDNYVAWPTIAQTADGELLVTFSGDRDEHVCPYGKTELIRSRDDGETWTAPEVVNNTPLDDRDSGIIVLKSGTIVVSWFTHATWEKLDHYRTMGRWTYHQIDAWDRYCRKLSPETREKWLGNWTRRSTDGGRTWEDPVDSIVSGPHGPTETQDSRLVYVGRDKVNGTTAIVCSESTDGAQSWQQIGTIPGTKETTGAVASAAELFMEPHVIEVAADDLVCLMRSKMGLDYSYSTRSLDGGHTWSEPEPTPMYAYDQPTHLLVLSDGRLLGTYGRRFKPFGERACLSEDGGRSWLIDDEIVLRDDTINTDMGYPATVEIEPGELLTVYYQINRPGEKVSINATRWSLS